MHLYLVVDCKTERCKTKHVLKYLGEKGNAAEEVPISIPAPLIIQCPDCKVAHQYDPHHIRKLEMDEPPPKGFEDKI